MFDLIIKNIDILIIFPIVIFIQIFHYKIKNSYFSSGDLNVIFSIILVLYIGYKSYVNISF